MRVELHPDQTLTITSSSVPDVQKDVLFPQNFEQISKEPHAGLEPYRVFVCPEHTNRSEFTQHKTTNRGMYDKARSFLPSQQKQKQKQESEQQEQQEQHDSQSPSSSLSSSIESFGLDPNPAISNWLAQMKVSDGSTPQGSPDSFYLVPRSTPDTPPPPPPPPKEEILLINTDLTRQPVIMEGSITTVYFRRGDKWITPSAGGLPGVTRRWAQLQGWCELGTVKVETVKIGEVVLLSNGVMGFGWGRIEALPSYGDGEDNVEKKEGDPVYDPKMFPAAAKEDAKPEHWPEDLLPPEKRKKREKKKEKAKDAKADSLREKEKKEKKKKKEKKEGEAVDPQRWPVGAETDKSDVDTETEFRKRVREKNKKKAPRRRFWLNRGNSLSSSSSSDEEEMPPPPPPSPPLRSHRAR